MKIQLGKFRNDLLLLPNKKEELREKQSGQRKVKGIMLIKLQRKLSVALLTYEKIFVFFFAPRELTSISTHLQR